MAGIFVDDFAANPAIEGPQVIVSWTFPDGFSGSVDEIRLVRRQGSFPSSVSDGKLVFSSTTFSETEFADLDVERGICFYYKMFSKESSSGLFRADSTVEDEVMPYETGFFKDALARKLPDEILIQDAIVGEQKILTDTIVPLTDAGVRKGQKLNFAEDPEFPEGFLRRMLKIFGVQLDKIKETADFFPDFIDVDKTCASFLPLLSDLVGITPNFDLSIDRQREEIRRAVPSYKIKGTQAMLVSLITGIVRIVPIIDLWKDNVLISNDPESTSFSFEPDDINLQFLPNDPNDYIASDDPTSYNLNRVAVFLEIPAKGITKVEIDKLRRTLPDFVPARIELVFIFLTEDTEVYDAGEIIESRIDSILLGDLYSADVEEETDDTFDTRYLITNDPERLTSDLMWVTGGKPSI